ncbi:hypothetical protein [Natronobacterium gregoryi]|uniref:Uncharacterized protein n=2 Tax=Natronobacterium gregoryi TaxID=44930 RepID=L0AHX5_NATGS|nr:hypothetical protein [Natronobacterium gregoryi]AFZ73044.1 hypothetical protein Natgr_1859 [Natronobacterium gregoryi SP2]ELY70850.1 hypothetical protein C490_06152 [Natronobacterium gregoryi SP2]PLK20431.1 hypothetical protein CYV19_09900 [Natronobacterium gregoryi SP2]SFI62895.1 hypothetical protein SAMN05443661_102222 [Natronobacterium gregoryi]
MSSSAESVNWSNPETVDQHEEKTRQREEERKEQRRENASIKQQLQRDREQHTFYVEWYNDRELPFNPLPKEAADALDGKRERMAHCAQSGNWEEFAEQADFLAQNAAEWLAEAWDGDEMLFAEDWRDIYDDDELLELLNKVDQRGEGAETEAVLEFLGQ